MLTRLDANRDLGTVRQEESQRVQQERVRTSWPSLFPMQREAMKSITSLTRCMSSPHKLIDCSQPPSKYLEATAVHLPDLNAGHNRHQDVTPLGLPLPILSSKSILDSFPDWALRIHSDTGGQYLIKHLDSLLSHERSNITALTEEPIVFCGRLDAS